jgi:hypothetical protein
VCALLGAVLGGTGGGEVHTQTIEGFWSRPLCGGRHGILSYTAFDICGRCIEAAKKKGLI